MDSIVSTIWCQFWRLYTGHPGLSLRMDQPKWIQRMYQIPFTLSVNMEKGNSFQNGGNWIVLVGIRVVVMHWPNSLYTVYQHGKGQFISKWRQLNRACRYQSCCAGWMDVEKMLEKNGRKRKKPHRNKCAYLNQNNYGTYMSRRPTILFHYLSNLGSIPSTSCFDI